MAEKTQTRRGPLGWVKRHKKLTIFLAILLVAALVLVNVLGKTDKAAADSYQFVRTTVLTKTTLSDTVSVTGTVKAGSSASVTASDSVKTYKVTAVNVAVGDTVRKGDVIATLDTTDVEKQIANAQLQLSDTRTDARKNYTQAVEDQTTNLATAQENLDKAQKNYDTLGMDDYYTSMASAANSGKTNREIVTDWYTRYAEEIAGYENTLANLNIQLTQAKQAEADLLFLPIYYEPASLILSQAKAMGYAPTFFGVDGMDGILTMEGFDPSLAEGLMLLTPFSATVPETKSFVDAYVAANGVQPNQFAADAYDGVYIVKEALEKAGCTADMSSADICEALVAQMTQISYSGLTGKDMTWNAEGQVSKAPTAYVIKGGEYVLPEA